MLKIEHTVNQRAAETLNQLKMYYSDLHRGQKNVSITKKGGTLIMMTYFDDVRPSYITQVLETNLVLA